MDIAKKALLIQYILVCQLFVLPFSVNADTIFFIIPKNSSSEIHCDFLTIKSGIAYCKENNTLAAHNFKSIARIIIIKDGKTFKFEKEIMSNPDELDAAINTVNKEKMINYQKRERERQRKIDKQRDERKRKQEENERYYRKYNACKELYDEQCKNECSENKYEYSKSCYNLCIEENCLD